MTKLVSLKEAVAECVQDEDTLVIEGFTHLICHAAGHEIIRQKKKNLTLARLTPDTVYDQMIEAGVCKKLVFSWAGNPGVGSLHAVRRHTEAKYTERIELEEYSHGGMMTRLQAGSMGQPFGMIQSFNGTDIPKVNPAIKEITCPYTQKKIQTVPALNPDVCVVHVQRADKNGNAQVWGLMGTQKESAFAAKKVIVVAEEIVEASVIRRDPNRTLIPEVIVDCVVHEPWGCHPSFAQGYYDRDNDFYVNWDVISRDSKTYADWLNEFVYSSENHADYMKKLGTKTMERLKAKSRMCEGVDYGY
ncbi:CoA transferase subunit A [bacterium]|nr:CoA transferase subunit A [bacterium]